MPDREPPASVSRVRVPSDELRAITRTRVYLVRRADGRYGFATAATDGVALAGLSASAAHPGMLSIHEPPAVPSTALVMFGATIHAD